MRKALFGVLAVVLVSGTATAVPVRWTLSGVTFTDGGTASGSFVYDAATNTYSSVNIVTTAGSVITSGATLIYVSPGVVPTSTVFLAGASNAADLTGTRAFALSFGAALSNAGGTVAFSGQEASCSNATCAAPAAPARFTTAGSVNGLLAVSDVPALSPWALAATGLLLAAAGFAALRRGVF